MKRLFDFIVSIVLSVVLAPVIILLACVTLISMGRPIFYVQERPGLHAKVFRLVKFRTMSLDVDSDGQPLPDGMRLTGFGKFLRATSLDELPEMWNIMKGDMSLVGPRPLLIQYLGHYSAEQARRHDVQPGLTGWAQINGRNALSWEEKFLLDVWYVDHQSFLLDLRILFMTVFQVLFARGINQPNSPTVEKFKGNIE